MSGAAVWAFAVAQAAVNPVPEPSAASASLRVGGVTQRVAALAAARQEYALFIPEGYSTDRKWPVLFVLDPRGRAVSALELFVDAASRHGYLILSSYQSRSDVPVAVTARALEAMLQDAEQRLAIDPVHLYITGMSGTSHAAWRWGTALGANVAGVIGCAGGLPNDWDIEVKNVPFAYFGIAGLTDFNYQEMRELHGLLDEAGAEHRFETFDGAHGWPPKRLTNAALDWMELLALKSGAAHETKLDVENLLRRDVASLEAAEEEVLRYRRLRQVVRDYRGLVDVTVHEADLRELEGRESVSRGLKREAKFAATEKDYFKTRFGSWLRALRAEERLAPTLKRSLVDLRIAQIRKQSGSSELPEARSAQRLIESLYSSTFFYIPDYFLKRRVFDRAGPSPRALEAGRGLCPRRARRAGDVRLARGDRPGPSGRSPARERRDMGAAAESPGVAGARRERRSSRPVHDAAPVAPANRRVALRRESSPEGPPHAPPHPGTR